MDTRQRDTNIQEKFIQWNLKSIYAKKPELIQLIHLINPVAIALQETRLKPSQSIKINNYKIYRKDFEGGENASDGVAILTHEKYYSQEINLQTNIQAIAVRIKTHSLGYITLCSLYLPPQTAATVQELHNLIEQLPKPFIIMSDANAHNQLWGGAYKNRNGKIMEQLLLSDDQLIILNTGEPTHMSIASGNTSIIDLTIASNGINTKLLWNTHKDLCFSDHFPIIITSSTNSNLARIEPATPTWNLKKANWTMYEAATKINAVQDSEDVDELYKVLTDLIENAANDSIPLRTPIIKNTHHGGILKSLMR